MWKKLASLLFEEEEDVIEEDLNDKVKQVKQDRDLIPSIIMDNPIKQERSLIASMNPKPIEDVKEQIAIKGVLTEIENEGVEDIIKPIKPEFGIAFSEPIMYKEKTKILKENPIYEFNPVISPMFGVSESKRRLPIRQTITTPQVIKRSRINTVISPIYGDVETKTTSLVEPVQGVKLGYKHDSFIDHINQDLPKLKTENYSLDDLLSPIKPQDDFVPFSTSLKEDEEELSHQFSLFDEVK